MLPSFSRLMRFGTLFWGVFVAILGLLRADSAPLLWNIPLESTKFVGRIKNLSALDADLQEGPVVISGLAGVGKTSLAYQYVRLHHKRYSIGWKFDASKEMSSQVINFAQKLSDLDPTFAKPVFTDPQKCVIFMKNWLRRTKRSWVLVFDDAPSRRAMIPYMPETHGHGDKHLLMTSLSTRKQECVMKLEKFSEGESLSLLRYHFGASFPLKEALVLAKALDHHPLALRQAISFIQFTPGYRVEDYLELFRHKNAEFLQAEKSALKNDLFRPDQPELHTAIKLSLDKLKAEAPESYFFFLFLSQIHYRQIEGKLMRAWMKKFTPHNPALFGALLERALIAQVEESLTSDTYEIHSYICDVVLRTATQQEKIKAQDFGVDLFSDFLSGGPNTAFSSFEVNSTYATHLENLFASKKEIASDKALDLAVKLLYHSYYNQRRYDFSEKLAQKINHSLESQRLGTPLSVASFYSINSYMRYLQEDLFAAIEEAQKAYRLLQDLKSEEGRRELVLLLCNNLGFYHYWQGDIESFERYWQEASSVMEGLHDAKLLFLIHACHLLILHDRGNFEAALSLIPMIEKLYEEDPLFEKVTGHLLLTMQAMLALKQNRNEDALKFAQSALKNAIESVDGNDLLEVTARPLPFLSVANSRWGSFKEAEQQARKALRIFEKTYRSPNKSRRQAEAHFALGISLVGQHRYEEALTEYLFAKELYEVLFVQLKIDDISELYLNILDVGIKLKDELLIKDTMDQHFRLFGLTHPRSIEMARFASAL